MLISPDIHCHGCTKLKENIKKVWSVIHYDDCMEEIKSIRSFTTLPSAIKYLKEKVKEVKKELKDEYNTIDDISEVYDNEYHILYNDRLCDIIKIMESEVE